MAHRHKVQAAANLKRAHGGGVKEEKPDIEEQSPGEVVKASRERKHGGRAEKEGYGADERKRGGGIDKRATGGAVAGAKAATRMDRPGRKRGGGVGADTSPLSSANRSSPQRLAQQH